MNLKKFAVIGLMATIIAGGAGAYLFLKNKADSFEIGVQQHLQTATGRNVGLKNVTFDFLSTTGSIEELTIYDSAGADKPLFTFSNVKIDLAPNTIFMGVLRIKSISASEVAANISGNGSRIVDLAKSAGNASRKMSVLSGKPLVIVESVSLPAGTIYIGGSVFGLPPRGKVTFGPINMAGLGEKTGGQPLSRILNQITGTITGRVLRLPYFRSALR